MRLKLDTELREYVEFQCQDKIWDMRGIAADTVDGYGRIDNLINPLFWVGTDTNRRVCKPKIGRASCRERVYLCV